MPVRGGTLRQAHGRRSKHRGHGARTLALTASMLGAGLLVAACGSNSSSTATTAASGGGSTPTTAASGGGTANGVDSLLNGVSKSSGATFSATYLTVEASTGKSQTVTFAQSPPKSAITTASASFYIDGTAITD